MAPAPEERTSRKRSPRTRTALGIGERKHRPGAVPPRRILVIEDDIDFGEQLRTAFEEAGWDTTVSISAESGLLRAEADHPDLVVLDIILPDLSGFELLAKLKGDKRTWQIPVLMFSNLDEPEDVRHARELGALDFLSKTRHDVAAVARRIEKFFKDGR